MKDGYRFLNYKSIINKLGIILSFIISGYFLFLTFKMSNIEFNGITLSYKQALGLTISIISYSIVNYIQSFRIKLFWNKRPLYTYASVLIGRFYNSILPSQTGEIIRAWHFHKKNKIKFLESLTSILLEKYIDAVLSISTIVLFIIVAPPLHYSISAYIYTVISIIIIATIVFILALYNSYIIKYLLRNLNPLKSLSKYVFKLYLYLKYHIIQLLATKKIIKFSLISYAMFFFTMVQTIALLWALEICNFEHLFFLSWFVSYMIMIIAIIPSAPSGLGVLHYGLYLTLQAYFLSNEISIHEDALQKFALFAILFHLSQLIPDLIIGAILTIKERAILLKFKESNSVEDSL